MGEKIAGVVIDAVSGKCRRGVGEFGGRFGGVESGSGIAEFA